jgi:peptidoglycan hydrolase CwlO-like protein
VGAGAVATVFVGGWVKASHIDEIKSECKDLRGEVNKLWEKVSKIAVLDSKLDSLEKGIIEIKEMIRSKKEV